MSCDEGGEHANRLHDRSLPIATDLDVVLAGRPIDVVAMALAFALSGAIMREPGIDESDSKAMRLLAEFNVSGTVMGCHVTREERLRFLLMLAYSVLFTAIFVDVHPVGSPGS